MGDVGGLLQRHIHEDVPKLWEERHKEAESRENMEAEIVERAAARIRDLKEALQQQRSARQAMGQAVKERIQEALEHIRAEVAQEKVQRLAAEAMLNQAIIEMERKLLEPSNKGYTE